MANAKRLIKRLAFAIHFHQGDRVDSSAHIDICIAANYRNGFIELLRQPLNATDNFSLETFVV
jgi:hypothetical protein